MRVRMRYQISGYRNGDRWPPGGGTLDLPEDEALGLIRGEMADPDGAEAEAAARRVAEQPVAGHPSKLDPVAAPPAGLEDTEPPGELPSLAPDAADAGRAGIPDEAAVDVAAAEPSAVPVAPGPSAPKQAWIDYAVNVHGADVHAATNMSKADLMSRYGGRL